MAEIKEKVICPWCKEEMRPYPHQGYYWFQCKCGARSPTLWNATEKQTREKALSYTADVAPRAEVIEEYRKKVYAKMEKYTVFGREYIQRIMREVEKEMKGGE